MYKENKTNSRAAFLKKVSLVFVSVVGIGFAGFNFQKLRKGLGFDVKTISDEDAREVIRNMPSPKSHRLKPEPPPNRQPTPEG